MLYFENTIRYSFQRYVRRAIGATLKRKISTKRALQTRPRKSRVQTSLGRWRGQMMTYVLAWTLAVGSSGKITMLPPQSVLPSGATAPWALALRAASATRARSAASGIEPRVLQGTTVPKGRRPGTCTSLADSSVQMALSAAWAKSVLRNVSVRVST